MYDNGFFLIQICFPVGPRCAVHLHLLSTNKCAATPSVIAHLTIVCTCTLIAKVNNLTCLYHCESPISEWDIIIQTYIKMTWKYETQFVCNLLYSLGITHILGHTKYKPDISSLLCQTFSAVFLINHKSQQVITNQVLDWPKWLKAYVFHSPDHIFVQIHLLKVTSAFKNATQ